VGASCECSNKTSGSIRCLENPENVSNWWLLKTGSAPWVRELNSREKNHYGVEH
jgi:hypothetical protein